MHSTFGSLSDSINVPGSFARFSDGVFFGRNTNYGTSVLDVNTGNTKSIAPYEKETERGTIGADRVVQRGVGDVSE